jgi:hypothetical protein
MVLIEDLDVYIQEDIFRCMKNDEMIEILLEYETLEYLRNHIKILKCQRWNLMKMRMILSFQTLIILKAKSELN